MALATTIDLSKIKAKELPTKTVKANFGDGEKEYQVRALNDMDRIELARHVTNKSEVFVNSKVYLIALVGGLEAIGRDEDAARVLLDACTTEALKVANEILDLTNEFYTKKSEEREKAEKN